jgi:hypothetical protein
VQETLAHEGIQDPLADVFTQRKQAARLRERQFQAA